MSYIENELKRFEITEAAIAELSQKFLPLKIDGITDKEGYKSVREARLVMRNYRVDIEKRRKELVADALAFQRAINEEAKRITSKLSSIEDYLATQEKNYDEEIDRIKREKEQAEAAKLQTRINQILSIGFIFNGEFYIVDYSINSDETITYKIYPTELKVLSDETFDQQINLMKIHYGKKQAFIAESERKKKEQLALEEAERKAEADRLEQQRKEQAQEQLRLNAIAKEQAKKELELKAEANRLASKKAYEESKQAVIECEKNHEGMSCYEASKYQISDHEKGFNEGFLSALTMVYELAKNLNKQQLLEELEQEINERK